MGNSQAQSSQIVWDLHLRGGTVTHPGEPDACRSWSWRALECPRKFQDSPKSQARLIHTGMRRLELWGGRQIEKHCVDASPSWRGRPEVPGVASRLPWAKPVPQSFAPVAVQEQPGPTTTVPRPSKRLPSLSRISAAAVLRPPSIISYPTR